MEERSASYDWARHVRHRYEGAGLPSVGLPDVVTEQQARELIDQLVARLREPGCGWAGS